jgi:hypothetical protein
MVQMGHNHKDRLRDYWLTLEQYFKAFTEKLGSETDSIIYLDFYSLEIIKMNLKSQTKITIDWKMRAIFDKFSDLYVKYYSLTKQ